MLPQIQPWIDEAEVEAVRRAVATTFVTEHDETVRFEQLLRERTGARHAIAYCNATCGLFAALRAAGIGPGDEVIVPDLTFVATANAVILAGAKPVFCDVCEDTLMLDVHAASRLVSRRTRAVIPVHLYGMAADLDSLLSFARSYGLVVIEDAAQGLGVAWRGRHVGSFCAAGVLSFYGNKTITTGEGGAILTNDDDFAEACYRLKNHGRTEKGVFVHEEIGFNFSFTEMQAALGVAQLGKLDLIIAEKRRIRFTYEKGLRGVQGIRLQPVPAGVTPVFWFTNVICNDVQQAVADLKAAGVQSRRFFYPLHMQPCYQYLNPSPCPVSRRLYETGLSLPSSCGLSEESIEQVCDLLAGRAVCA